MKPKHSDAAILKELANYLTFDSYVIDIGAYTGDKAKNLCNKSNGDPSKYYLIEPCPSTFSILNKNCEQFNNFQLAISDVSGEVEFYEATPKNNNMLSQSNSIYDFFVNDKEWNEGTVVHKVKSITLDEFIKDNNIVSIDLLKMNCEGGEYKIFSASTLRFLEITKRIYLHLHGKHPEFLSDSFNKKRESIFEILEKNNFHFVMGEKKFNGHHMHQLLKKR